MKLIHAVIIGDEILSGKREDKHLRHLTQKAQKKWVNIKQGRFCP